MPNDPQLTENSGRGHLEGPGNAPVTLVEYGDFQCPACGQFYPIGRALIRHYGPKMDFVFKNFPLMSIHPRAMPAAQASEAAGKQGKFWPLHDRLFQNQRLLSASDLLDHARVLLLDMTHFEADFSSREILARIERDINQGMQNGVHQTPTLFINGDLYEGPIEESALRRAMDHALLHPKVPTSTQQFAP